jgi:hypothetical protein
MSVSKGNAGENFVMAELLTRNFDAYWADRSNRAFDIACFWNPTKRATRLRVKTTSDGGAVWTAKRHGLFLNLQQNDDYVVICDLRDGIRSSVTYIVPTGIVEDHLIRNHHTILRNPRGAARRDQRLVFASYDSLVTNAKIIGRMVIMKNLLSIVTLGIN